MIGTQLHYFAQVYGSDAYGGESYQCTGTECQTSTDSGVVTSTSGDSVSDSPAGGFGFLIAGFLILAAAVVITVIVVLLKKRFKRQTVATTSVFPTEIR